jgi:hypothetical protein
MKVRFTTTRVVVFAFTLASLAVPALLQGEILYLKDGSEIRGKVVAFSADTLTFDPSFGGRIRVYRGDIATVVFDEAGAPKREPRAAEPPSEAPGVLWVIFKDDQLSSKIAVDQKSKSIEHELERANWIEQLLIVGPDTVYSRIDTTKDKTIYKGHEKEFKNTIELEDMKATVPSGVQRCVVVVRNLGAREYEGAFREGPLDMSIEFKTVGIYPNQTTTLEVGIKKGFMRMGRPRFVPVD